MGLDFFSVFFQSAQLVLCSMDWFDPLHSRNRVHSVSKWTSKTKMHFVGANQFKRQGRRAFGRPCSVVICGHVDSQPQIRGKRLFMSTIIGQRVKNQPNTAAAAAKNNKLGTWWPKVTERSSNQQNYTIQSGVGGLRSLTGTSWVLLKNQVVFKQ